MSPSGQRLWAEMRQAWDNAPTLYTLDGVNVSLAGYVVPLSQNREGLSELLLVSYFGAYLHMPQPANQIVWIKLATPAKGVRTFDVVWASGRLSSHRQHTELGSSGYTIDRGTLKSYSLAEKKFCHEGTPLMIINCQQQTEPILCPSV